MRALRSIVAAAGLAVVHGAACGPGGFNDVCEIRGACSDADAGQDAGDASAEGGDASGGDDAGGDGAVLPPPGCDPSADPKDSPACVASAFGLFVSANGSDQGGAGDGTKERPYRSIGKALLELGGKSRVYVCAGSYVEAVRIAAPVSIYGGWKCGDWTYSGTKASVNSASGAITLTIGATRGVLVEDMTFTAAAATVNGGSSIAGFVQGSLDVTLRRASFVAQAALAGADGPSDGGIFAPPSAAIGKNGSASAGGAELDAGACSNGTGTTIGGAGGAPSSGGVLGGIGAAIPAIPLPLPDPTRNGAGGTPAECSTGKGGHAGSVAPGGGAGAAATTYGQLAATGWVPEGGTIGGIGSVGQGGGGGASIDATGGGGGGGAGGCGGSPGAAGNGGGSSIALAIAASSVTIDETTLTAAAAGKGGNGGGGQIAQAGGAGGGHGGNACNGGSGGHGGSGGGGGGGTGGLSVGILWTGTAPKVNGSLVQSAVSLAGITVGAGGAGGSGGAGGAATTTGANAGQAGAAGKPGVAQAVLGI